MTILITGANGSVSSALLASLKGQKARAMVRDPAKAPEGVDVVVGDLDEPSTLAEAFAGVDTLWLLTAMGPQAPHASMNAVHAAKQAGVKHVVRMSAIGAAHDAPTRNGRLHALSDHELRVSGLDWTIIKPGFFMQNLLGSVSGGTLYAGLGHGRLGMIDVRDIADFAAAVLINPAPHAGRTYTITGPASISLHEAAATVGATYQPVTDEQAHTAMIGFGLPDWIAAVSVEYGRAYASGWGDYTTPDFAQVVGRQARSFAEFARDHGLGS
ncbi:SDR family oxidoreductase [Streptosporangium sp. CA-135522]|uniref:SDR family oxidoreductase n=1 Tax=Streptosporangium sp. CA-135522 TaxID=3240072 RepID=UPI003D8AE78B